MAKVHELLGIAVEQQGLMQALLDTEKEAHLATIKVLSDLKAGRTMLSQVIVENNTWTVLSPQAMQVIEETTVNEPVNRVKDLLHSNGELLEK